MRSPEAMARRAAYTRAWRAAHPDYHPTYRRAHSDAERKAHWKAAHPEAVAAQRARDRAAARQRASVAPHAEVAPIPASHTGHPLFEAALAIVGPRPRPGGATVWAEEDVWQDVMSEATLALLDGRDVETAVIVARRAHRARAGHETPLLPSTDIAADGRVVPTGRRD